MGGGDVAGVIEDAPTTVCLGSFLMANSFLKRDPPGSGLQPPRPLRKHLSGRTGPIEQLGFAVYRLDEYGATEYSCRHCKIV